ncbi:peptidylprolyl isomerase [Nitratiruptor tergarcus]|uniref:Peptidyl-prolyl cis-trans isomerase D n=1 Tax=Nitratiruptor tergarcus DSM 16512 TaxID=1069081 RepID=A0A1W1WUU7_9BACT|nr:peptidylprolyl isomerase [Nitratiruptor tergarcus]SMC09810.1 peptidyl-prolyl cis-trans isomerase D [Nitratiruptor tergarcus DSM 16512]
MISWMQKHKKYLVITIWISTIAFVGAGFVGWGAYKYGSSGDTMVEVGDTKITIKEFQNKYSQLYNYYNKLLGGNLDQQKAKEMGIDKAAFDALIKEALLINYAKDHGLMVTDEEVAKKIASMQVFQRDGHFEKELYINVLKQNHMRPKDFEQSIKKELLLEKIKAVFKPKLLPLEFDTASAALFMGDKIAYKPLTSNDINISYTQKELKNYYNEHKDNYQTPTHYKLAVVEVTPQDVTIDDTKLQEYYQAHRIQYKDSSGKIMKFEDAKPLVERDYKLKLAKKEALKKYITLKKGKIKPQKSIEVTDTNTTLPPTFMEKLKLAQSGKVFKPIIIGEKYLIIKLDNKKLPQPMSFEEAKALVQKDFEKEQRSKKLIETAQKLAKTFKGIEINSFICRDDVNKIKALESTEAATFLKKLFTQKEGEGFVQLSDEKVVLYRILDQKLHMPKKIDKNRALITDNTIKLKELLESQRILNILQKLYEIKVYKGI